MANDIQTWEKYLTVKDFTDTAGFDGKTTDTSTWLMLKKEVGAKQVIKWGRSGIINGVDNRGILYMSIKDNAQTPVQVEGGYRIGYMDFNETKKVIIQEGHTSEMHDSKTVKNSANVLGVYPRGAGQDSYMFIEFLPDTASKVLELDNCDFNIPVTIHTKATI